MKWKSFLFCKKYTGLQKVHIVSQLPRLSFGKPDPPPKILVHNQAPHEAISKSYDKQSLTKKNWFIPLPTMQHLTTKITQTTDLVKEKKDTTKE